MKNKTPFQWFEEYQNTMTTGEGMELYGKLIKEEQDKFLEALKNKDIIEMYNTITNIIWFSAGKYSFVEKAFGEAISDSYIILSEMEWKKFFYYQGKKYEIFNIDCVEECIDEVSRSNFTKTKEPVKDGEKIGEIIKGNNYSKPNLEPILKKYGIL